MGPVSGGGYFAGAPVPAHLFREAILPSPRRHACEVPAEAGSCPHLIMGDPKAALETLRASVA